MKNRISLILLVLSIALMLGCADNSFEEYPQDDDFPFQLVLDSEEGADLASAEDIGVEFSLAEYLPYRKTLQSAITLKYSITDLEGDMIGKVGIDKIVYEVELSDCVDERELDFEVNENGLSGTILITPDEDLSSIPESFKIVFTLPGLDETTGSFKVVFYDLQSAENIQLGFPNVFEYQVLDNDLAGEWEIELASIEEFENFKEIFGPLNPALQKLNLEDITGKVKTEFEFEEMKFILELTETEEIVECKDGEKEMEVVNKEIEIEADYNAEDGEVDFEGSHSIENEGLVEDELDFIIEAKYSLEAPDKIMIKFFSVKDEDRFAEGEELFRSEHGVAFTFEKD